jgi:hypothetical protein
MQQVASTTRMSPTVTSHLRQQLHLHTMNLSVLTVPLFVSNYCKFIIGITIKEFESIRREQIPPNEVLDNPIQL